MAKGADKPKKEPKKPKTDKKLKVEKPVSAYKAGLKK